MKVGLVLHGYPPELSGGTENAAQAVARGLVRAGLEVFVVAGSMQWEGGFRTSRASDTDPESGHSYPVYRIHRADLYFDHWHKSASARVARAFRAILREERPDLVHVQHWIRLSRDLVCAAAREGIPAAVSLHDLWSTCLITFRVRPDTEAFCEAPLAASPCLSCAGSLPPRTPWVPVEAAHLMLFQHAADIRRELALARRVLVPSQAHAESVARFLGVDLGEALAVVPNGRDAFLERRSPLAPPAGDEPLRLGAWGHLTPLKGADLLLDALAQLSDPRRVRLELAGGEPDAAYAERLREKARDLDVAFHGPYEASALGSHPVSAVHAMVSGSRAHESWGLVLDEAWMLGLPAILPDEGAFRERVQRFGGGLLYPQGDAAALAAQLEELLADPARLAGLRASVPPAGEAVPTLTDTVARLEGLYQEVARQGAPEVPAEEWFEGRMQIHAEEEWDKKLSAASPEELGFA